MPKSYLNKILEVFPKFDIDIIDNWCPYHFFGDDAPRSSDEECNFKCEECWTKGKDEMLRPIDADALHRVYMSKGKDKLRLATVINELEMQKTIDAVHGRWIIEEREFSVMGKDGFIRSERKLTFTCSNPKCGVGIVGLENMNYCPNCGAKMDLEVDVCD